MAEMTEADRKACEGAWRNSRERTMVTFPCWRAVWQTALTHARGAQWEPVGREWRGLEKGAEPTPWMPHNHVVRSNWEVLVKRKPSRYQVEERALYAAPPAESEELARLREENERLRKAIEPFALVSTEGVIKKVSGHETVVTCAEYFHEAAAALASSHAPETVINAVCTSPAISKPKVGDDGAT